MIERDYIMRLAQQLAASLARIFRSKEQEQYDLALVETDQAFNELLGMSRELMAAFDSATLAQLLGHRERVKTAAELFRSEGEIFLLCEDQAQAQSAFKRALELYCEAALLQTHGDQQCEVAIRSLSALLPPESIARKYAEYIARLADDTSIPAKNG